MVRSAHLFRLFLAGQSDPDSFYAALARDAAARLEERGPSQNRPGATLFPVPIGPVLREVATWNLRRAP